MRIIILVLYMIRMDIGWRLCFSKWLRMILRRIELIFDIGYTFLFQVFLFCSLRISKIIRFLDLLVTLENDVSSSWMHKDL